MTEGERDAGKIKLIPKQCDLTLLINEMIKEAAANIKECPQIQFIHSQKSFIIFSDEKLLRQIFLNLISNAVKYTPPDKKVSLQVFEKDENVTVEIKDEGIGISQNDLKNIFDPFTRGENVGQKKGTGLGLSIVKRTVGILKGDIKVKSKINEGTIFSVVLPKNFSA